MFDPYPTAHAVGYVDVAAPRLREVAYLLIVRHSSLSTKTLQSTKKRTVTSYWPEGALLVALGIRAFLGRRNPAFITPHFRQITMPKTPPLQSQNLLCPFAVWRSGNPIGRAVIDGIRGHPGIVPLPTPPSADAAASSIRSLAWTKHGGALAVFFA